MTNLIKMIRKTKNNKGFTLVEMMLYVVLAATVIASTVILLQEVLESRIKNQVVNEIEGQGSQLVWLLSHEIMSADALNNPQPADISASLELASTEAAENPTIIDLDGDTIRITEGADAPVSLTSSKIAASNLNFQNLSNDETVGVVRFEFTLTYFNPGSRSEYNYSKTFSGSANIRR
ncbi:MAG: hypothetical protein GF347_03855 [Candidatus Moranbacteria bacterium]|nr:hypothetical protein [Candidatus Moranbacteria bacterium]